MRAGIAGDYVMGVRASKTITSMVSAGKVRTAVRTRTVLENSANYGQGSP
jgi:hypothetical protein